MTRRRNAAALRARFREWWPEATCAALLLVIAFAGQKDDPLFAVFCAITGAIFWAMGIRHRRLPLQATLDGVRQDVSEVREIITAAVAAAEDEPPARPGARLKVVR